MSKLLKPLRDVLFPGGVISLAGFITSIVFNTFAKIQSGLKNRRIPGTFRAQKWLKSNLAKVLVLGGIIGTVIPITEGLLFILMISFGVFAVVAMEILRREIITNIKSRITARVYYIRPGESGDRCMTRSEILFIRQRNLIERPPQVRILIPLRLVLLKTTFLLRPSDYLPHNLA